MLCYYYYAHHSTIQRHRGVEEYHMGWGGVESVEGEAALHHIFMYMFIIYNYIYLFYLNDMICIYKILILLFLIMLQMSSGTPPRYRIHIWHAIIYDIDDIIHIFSNIWSVFFFWNDEIKGAFWSISLTFALRCLTTWSPTLKVSRPHQASPGLTENHRLVGKPSILKVCLTASWWIVLLHQDSVWHSN